MNISKSSPERSDKGNESSFDIKALKIFRTQATNNPIYRQYLEFLGTNAATITNIGEIPFMPIEFFKFHAVKTNEWQAEKVFESSGTTGVQTSQHYIKSLQAYHVNAQAIFTKEFGELQGKIILGLLPAYLERSNSSLISMVDYFIKQSANPNSGFYLNEYDKLTKLLMTSNRQHDIYLFGVTFALLDLAEKQALDLSHVTIIETGGMKGRRAEIVKDELYEILKKRLNLNKIYTEYGMTELLSQAYGREGRMLLPETMKVLIRDINDPFNYLPVGRSGGINIIDLANEHSCSFIETKDLGRINEDNSFEILGRFDNADIRGCNLLVS